MAADGNSKEDLRLRGVAARGQGDLALAEQLLRAALALDPADPETLHHLGAAYEIGGELAAAEQCYRRALALAPASAKTAEGLGLLLLSQGRYEEGFRLVEARHAREGYAKPDMPYKEWTDGRDVAGRRILVWPEQGLGDQIMFARFAPVLQAMGAEVTMVCLPPLARLFAGSLGVQVFAASGKVSFPDPDLWVMVCALAGRLGVTPETLPNAPYLKAVSRWEKPLPEGLRVGVMASGNPRFSNDLNRSLPPRAAERLLDLPWRMIDLSPSATGAADLADTAAIIDQLDLVISVDTAVAHLAGAMGKPCWVLLPAVAVDWRWMRGRRDSPWYPSLRLYRNAAVGDWSAVLAEVEADLQALAASSEITGR